MKTMYLAALLVAIGCSSAVEVETVAEEAQPVITTVVAWNGTANLPSKLTHFCHPTFISGAGAHSQAIVQWGVPLSNGGIVGGDLNAISALPNNGQTPLQGSMLYTVQCNPWSDFHGSGSVGYSPEFALTWNQSATLQAVSGSVNAWGIDVACHLDYLSGVSAPQERAYLDVVNGNTWRLNASGFRGLSASARCAGLGRVMSYNGGWLDATPGNDSGGTFATSAGTCLIYHVEGSIDDGSVKLDTTGGVWTLKVTGSVARAKAYCFTY